MADELKRIFDSLVLEADGGTCPTRGGPSPTHRVGRGPTLSVFYLKIFWDIHEYFVRVVPKNSIILELMVGLVPPEVDQVPLIEWDGVPPSAPNKKTDGMPKILNKLGG